eukprot:CAMPEP_0184859700 /NCGR_PEP_ID=MMETSP0580-20130426/4690_1 /TAXON_ID=1118495 /ORGANISM="Dactyliosolen fragilissimus" /LENGTH=340 /DNA_ID=CAMNT_0027356485 /DNA_START=34 /DNA_END=1056 /DNA_ORIENTATION=-
MKDFVLFALTAAGATFSIGKKTSSGDKDTKISTKKILNSAFVFVKPHANTKPTQDLVREKLTCAGIKIVSESDIPGDIIDEKKLIDQHYYAIASKATILPAEKIPVPSEKFASAFGESWETALTEKRAVNAMDACKRFNCDADKLNEAWGKSEKVVKFGGGFYCGLVSVDGKPPLYVFNAFFMSMRSKFVGKEISIHCYEVEWNPDDLSWSSFRNELLGPTDPSDGPEESIRKTILNRYKTLGLKSVPNKGDNGVHASASPFEGLAEKTNWLGHDISNDQFGKALIQAGLSVETIKEWSVDPRIEVPAGGKSSVFDELEDLDADECLKKLIELNSLNNKA